MRFKPVQLLFMPLLSLLLLLVLSHPMAGWAQSDTQEPEPSQATGRPDPEAAGSKIQYTGDLQTAPVIVNGEALFHLVGSPSIPAKKRARQVSRRIEVLADNEKYNPETLRMEPTSLGYEFSSGKGGKPFFAIIHEDAEIEGLRLEVVGELYREKIIRAIGEYRYERQPEVMQATVVRALGRTIGLVAILWLVVWFFRLLNTKLEKRIKARMKTLEAKSLRIIQAEQIWRFVGVGLRVLRAFVILFIIYVFLNFVLSLFPWTRYVSITALSYLVNPLRQMALAVIDFIPSLIFLILLYYVTRYVLKLIYQFFAAIARERIHLDSFEADWALPTYRIVRVLVIVLAVVIAYPYIPGSDSEAFKGISIIFGVLFSLGSTSVISNVVAGYTMTYRRAFRVGDRVKIGDTVGDVLEMRILVTHVRSLKNEEVVIPNSTILNNDVVNYSKLAGEQGLILHTTVGIGYEVPWRQVEAMLLMAADRTEGLLKEPEPFVLQTALADFAVNYEINAYSKDEKRATALYSELHRNIQDVFNEHEISIMTPAYEADTPDPKIVPEDQWYAAPATKTER